jgi:superfamily I DNA and/or RNA helicase
VILSTVATTAASIGWLNERPNLMNVAVSRAKDRLVIVGDVDALASGVHTGVLVRDA